MRSCFTCACLDFRWEGLDLSALAVLELPRLNRFRNEPEDFIPFGCWLGKEDVRWVNPFPEVCGSGEIPSATSMDRSFRILDLSVLTGGFGASLTLSNFPSKGVDSCWTGVAGDVGSGEAASGRYVCEDCARGETAEGECITDV